MSLEERHEARSTLEYRLRAMEAEIARLRAARDIANIQGRYIYYLQSHQYERIIELFAHNTQTSIEMDDLGRFVGREKVEAIFLNVMKPLYMTKGALGLHMLTTPVIEVEDSGDRGWGMWHTLGCNTQPDFIAHDSGMSEEPELLAMWQQGKYYMNFIREAGDWKIVDFRWYTNFRTPFDKGWVKQPITGNLSVVRKFFPGCPEPDGTSHYDPFDPAGLTAYLPVPPDSPRPQKGKTSGF